MSATDMAAPAPGPAPPARAPAPAPPSTVDEDGDSESATSSGTNATNRQFLWTIIFMTGALIFQINNSDMDFYGTQGTPCLTMLAYMC